MSATILVGAQWGDEGKGKITDFLAEKSQVIVRSQGGNNAGHTVINGSNEYKLHLIPSGILYLSLIHILKTSIGDLNTKAAFIGCSGYLTRKPKAEFIPPPQLWR